jgi:hypothetical protein
MVNKKNIKKIIHTLSVLGTLGGLRKNDIPGNLKQIIGGLTLSLTAELLLRGSGIEKEQNKIILEKMLNDKRKISIEELKLSMKQKNNIKKITEDKKILKFINGDIKLKSIDILGKILNTQIIQGKGIYVRQMKRRNDKFFR